MPMVEDIFAVRKRTLAETLSCTSQKNAKDVVGLLVIFRNMMFRHSMAMIFTFEYSQKGCAFMSAEES